MIYVIFCFVFFILTVTVQMVVHRILLFYKIRTFATIHVLTLGCFVNAVLQYFLFRNFPLMSSNSIWLQPVPMTASFLYVLLYFFYITYSASPYLGQEGPTSKILNLFKKNPSLTEAQVISTFTDKETVDARIDDLLISGWARVDGSYILLNPIGNILARFISMYRNILGLQRGG